MHALVRLLVAVFALAAALNPAYGRVPLPIFCWSPDHEFPVSCDEDEGSEDD